jgi:hypothetical protein
LDCACGARKEAGTESEGSITYVPLTAPFARSTSTKFDGGAGRDAVGSATWDEDGGEEGPALADAEGV